jgi:hypothetical protein
MLGAYPLINNPLISRAKTISYTKITLSCPATEKKAGAAIAQAPAQTGWSDQKLPSGHYHVILI